MERRETQIFMIGAVFKRLKYSSPQIAPINTDEYKDAGVVLVFEKGYTLRLMACCLTVMIGFDSICLGLIGIDWLHVKACQAYH